VALTPASSGKSLLNTPRFKARQKVLRQAFSIDEMERCWKKYVRPGLRDQEVLDLYDYNDFHWGRKTYFESLQSEILAGTYMPSAATPVRIEKANGVNRTLIIPSAQDSIVLQCIVEHILQRVLAKQPSKNAFFSRSHGFAATAVDFDSNYIWFRRWRKFASLRFRLSKSYPYICTTDIANYFDNIDYRHLRNILSSVARIDEVILDVMFKVLEDVSWRPDYLPPAGRSLPQVNFDAPRLLAHAYLFEIDAYLKFRTNDTFVRWVDDMTIPASSYEEAKGAARDLDQLLMTRGLRLNAGKTSVLSAAQARQYFYQVENAYLDVEIDKAQKLSGQPLRLAVLIKRAVKRFSEFNSKPKIGQWDKVAKRYITLFTNLKNDSLVVFCSKSLLDQPTLRDSIWRYFSALGPSKRLFDVIKKYLMSDHALDDASVFRAANVIVNWPISPNSKLHKNAKLLGHDMGSGVLIEKSQFYFVGGLRLISKYGYTADLHQFLLSTKNSWSTSDLMSRQVAATLPKFRTSVSKISIRKTIEAHKLPSANSVLMSLDHIYESAPKLDTEVRMYILNGKNKSNYTIDRFMLALHVLLCKKLSVNIRVNLKKDLLLYIQDPLYSKVIGSVNPTP